MDKFTVNKPPFLKTSLRDLQYFRIAESVLKNSHVLANQLPVELKKMYKKLPQFFETISVYQQN